MSIIERAVAKFDRGGKAKPSPTAEAEVNSTPEDRVEPTLPPSEEVPPIASDIKPVPIEVAPAAPPQPARAPGRQVIDFNRLREAGMVTPDGERSPIFEEFRLLKRPLIKNALNQGPAPVRNGNLIMVTSALPGEGKSFCAANLAMSIAMEMDHTVLLVDADLAHPSIPAILGLRAKRGFMDVLVDDRLSLPDVLVRTNVEKLSILPAGRVHPHSTEILASAQMADLLEEMAHRYSDRLIIFDSPPLLVTTESRVLASHMGQIVLVVESGKTTQHAVREALSYIDSCEVINLLLNKSTSAGGSGYYGYGYYGSAGA